MRITYTVTNRISRESLFIESLPEDIVIQFTAVTPNLVQVTEITFPTSNLFRMTDNERYIIQKFLHQNISELPTIFYQRNPLFFGLQPIQARCIDAAIFIANDFKQTFLNKHHINDVIGRGTIAFTVSDRSNYGFLAIENLPEDISIYFTPGPHNTAQITAIKFPTQYSYSFCTISQREKILDKYLNKYLHELTISYYQRHISFFGPTTIHTKCMDTAMCIASEFKKLFQEETIVIYKKEGGLITASSTSDERLFEEYAALPQEHKTFDAGTEEAINLRSLLAILPHFSLNNAGHIDVASEDGCGWLDYIEVDEFYRGRGIGSCLVKLAIRYLGLNCISCVKEARQYQYCLTELGEALVVSCIKKGIITGDMCYFSTLSTYRSTVNILEEDEEDDDPGLDSRDIIEALSAVKQLDAAMPTVTHNNDDDDDDDDSSELSAASLSY